MSVLPREHAIQEIDRLDREVEDLIKRMGPKRESLPYELQEDLDELESSIVLARQFTSSNSMDPCRVAIGLRQLRALKAEILSSLNGSKI